MQNVRISLEKLDKYFSKLSSAKILVLGDVGLDEYVLGSVKRISPEAPVPILEVTERYKRLGLSANVVANIKSLGVNVEIISVVGQDTVADILKEQLESLGVSVNFFKDSKRKTTVKTRVIADALHHVARIDEETKLAISDSIQNIILETFKNKVKDFDLVILEDYAKGFFMSEQFTQNLISLANASAVPVFVDPNRNTPSAYYKNATLLKPNRDELVALSNSTDYTKGALSLLEKLDLKYLLLTRGKDGMELFTEQKHHHIDSFALDVYDVSGAGDTVIAVLSSFFARGIDILESVYLANVAAATVVSKVGTAVVSRNDIVSFLSTHL